MDHLANRHDRLFKLSLRLQEGSEQPLDYDLVPIGGHLRIEDSGAHYILTREAAGSIYAPSWRYEYKSGQVSVIQWVSPIEILALLAILGRQNVTIGRNWSVVGRLPGMFGPVKIPDWCHGVLDAHKELS